MKQNIQPAKPKRHRLIVFGKWVNLHHHAKLFFLGSTCNNRFCTGTVALLQEQTCHFGSFCHRRERWLGNSHHSNRVRLVISCVTFETIKTFRVTQRAGCLTIWLKVYAISYSLVTASSEVICWWLFFDSVHCTQVVSYTGQVQKKSRLNMIKCFGIQR